MKRALFCLLVLTMIPACPGEKQPAAGSLEPLPTFDPDAPPPPPPPAPAAKAAPVVAAKTPTAAELAAEKTCCVFADGNRMRGLSPEECKASAGTFDAECKAKVEAPAPAAGAPEGEGGPCCIFPNGMKREGVPQEACEAGKGEYALDCED